MAKYFFCGIGGIGMNPLALMLKELGNDVAGSDRTFNEKTANTGIFAHLRERGIKVFPQDGSGLNETTDYFIVSTAVEETVFEYQKAKKLGIQIITRPKLLASTINNSKISFAIGGTSGKTTTTGIIGHILKELGKDPLIINGGVILNYGESFIFGKGPIVAEADESNGTIELYSPTYSTINNISFDHKSLEELYAIFSEFTLHTKKKVVVNADNELTLRLAQNGNREKIFTFGINNPKADFNAYDIKLKEASSNFTVNGTIFTINIGGMFNIQNALTALAILHLYGIPLSDMVEPLSTFKGIRRRMEVIGNHNDITVIDDFAHNPDKISSVIKAVKPYTKGKLIAIFQPHGFTPTRLMKDGYINAFTSNLDRKDVVIMPEIYYAGGSVTRDISAKDLTDIIHDAGIKAEFFNTRTEIIPFIKEIAEKNDRILVMGARDMTLNDFAKEIFEGLSCR